jgi:hypothetical protein
MKSGFHVVPVGAGGPHRRWGVTERGWTLCTSRVKRNAIRVGRALAKEGRTSLRIHGQDGRIQEERSYGNETTRRG